LIDFDVTRAGWIPIVELNVRSINSCARQLVQGVATGIVAANSTCYNAAIAEHRCPVSEVGRRAAKLPPVRKQVPDQFA
jgi:hypothetical protein